MTEMGNREIEVSILCITYNQKKYIAKALDSMLSQITDFEYEIIIHDDGSTDGTIEIIKDYKEKNPEEICLLIEEDNRYSKGEDFVIPTIREYARGKYIALCEGDDYWTDSFKLQKQRDALEKHQVCDMCACWGSTVTEDGTREISQIRPLQQDGILDIREVILGGGQYLVTAGLFFKKDMLENLYGLDSLDYSLQIRGALRGGIYYLDQKMAVYRRYADGSWTNHVLKKDAKLEVQWDKERNLLKSFDEQTDYQYHEIIEERLKAYTSFEIQLNAHSEEIQRIMQQADAPVYIWGMGRRGVALEAYCKRCGYQIDGICDAIDEQIGECTQRQTLIVKTADVLKNAKTILASNRFAYQDIAKTDYKGQVYDFQEFMPRG